MELKSTLKTFNAADLKEQPGMVKGQTIKRLLGGDEHPTERITAFLASFKPGVVEDLHWHLIEFFYYIISGRAVLKDIEGKSYEVGPGDVIYGPPGIAASHEWEIKEELQLIGMRATTDPIKILQISVDKSTLESRIEFDYLMRREGGEFKSLY
jgi:mannose-6-phosphate isomerase-like protein (cupin superfamily)